MSRGESFLENRVFADPDCVGWSALELSQRRLFVRQCDRGVFDSRGLLNIAYDDHCRFLTGRVVHVASLGEGSGVAVDYASLDGPSVDHYDFLVNCTGFDLLEQLRGLFAAGTRAEIERQSGPLWDRPPDAEVPMGRALEVVGLQPAAAHPGPRGAGSGAGLRQPRLPWADGQPRAGAAAGRRQAAPSAMVATEAWSGGAGR